MTETLKQQAIALQNEIVNRELEYWDYDASKHRWSSARSQLEAMTSCAMNHALQQGYPLTGYGDNSVEDLILEAVAVLRSIRSACGADKENAGFTIWHHREDALSEVRNKKCPEIFRHEVEIATSEYLALPFRCTPIDRMLVDLLIATELYAFSNQMLNPSEFIGAASPLKKSVLLVFLMGQGANLLVAAVIGAGLWGLNWVGILPLNWLVWGLVGLTGLLFIAFALAVISLPSLFLRTRKQRKRALDLIKAMRDAYSDMNSQGLISASHIEERVKKAADLGVVWPAPLYVLLEDVKARGGRL